MESEREFLCELPNGPIPDSDVALALQKEGVEKSGFDISVDRLEVDEIVNRPRFRMHGMAANFAMKSSSFRRTPNE